MNEQVFQAAIYLRLSREDEGKKGEAGLMSNSIGNQKELVWDFIQKQPDIELYDIYIDDGFSGSSFDRPEFKRMLGDIEAGRVNCVVVKDLSRFGRDYIETGRYLQEKFPALGVRFIAVTDHYDSFFADMGESMILLPVKNFINDSYCRDISVKVKSQLEAKRKKGECVAPFAVYGYLKDRENKNHLVVDAYAAENVKRVFKWKLEGFSIAGIAQQLNSLGILSPREYKKALGLQYRGGFFGDTDSQWSPGAVKRILTNEVYLGHLVQGKTERVNYKVKKSFAKPRKEWVRAENTHEAIISEDYFQMVQNLLRTDGRISPGGNGRNPFEGLLFCGDCREQMIRRMNRGREKKRIYYICSSKNRGEGCTRHSIEDIVLKGIVEEMVRKYANIFLDEKRLSDMVKGLEPVLETFLFKPSEAERLKKRGKRYESLCRGLPESLEKGIITEEELGWLHPLYKKKMEESKEAIRKRETLVEEIKEKGRISLERLRAFQNLMEIREIDRFMISSLVKRIYIYENKRMEIEFSFTDPYRARG